MRLLKNQNENWRNWSRKRKKVSGEAGGDKYEIRKGEQKKHLLGVIT